MLDWKLQLIKDTITDDALMNSGYPTADSYISMLQESHKYGYVHILGNKTLQVVAVIVHKRPFVGDCHINTRNKNPWQIIKAIKQFTSWLFTHTSLEKLEGDTPVVNICPLVKRAGFEYEGTRKKSYYKDSHLIDVYTLGMVKGN